MKRKNKKPKKITYQRLYNITLHYLQRYDSSVENLKAVLMRRIYKSSVDHPIDPSTTDQWIEEIVEKMKSLGFLDDTRYIQNQVRSLQQSGKSRQFIYQKLRLKGIEKAIAAQEIQNQTTPLSDIESAFTYARKKRLGPFSSQETRQENRQKHLQSLCRAGFDFKTACHVIDSQEQNP